MWANLNVICRMPRTYLGTLWTVLRSVWGNLNFIVGGLCIFPKCIYFARQMDRAGITHVHAHFANHPAVAAFIIHRITRIPYSFTAHGSDLHRDRRMLRHGPLVCVPYSNDVNDFAMFARGAMTTQQALESLRDQFDQLYLEGAETGRIMNLGIHPHVFGQAGRVRALREFVDYAKGFEGVWFASREEIATWYLENHADHMG